MEDEVLDNEIVDDEVTDETTPDEPVVDDPVVDEPTDEPEIEETPEVNDNSLLSRLKRALVARDIVLPTDEILLDEISNATFAINERRKVKYDSEISIGHEHILIELCIEAISKYGAEGETSHSESGIGRAYDNASPYSQATLNKILPNIGAF